MRRSTRMLLGISVALITAASLHLTVGDRFHNRMRGRYGRFGCGHYEKRHYQKAGEGMQVEPKEDLNSSLNNNQ